MLVGALRFVQRRVVAVVVLNRMLARASSSGPSANSQASAVLVDMKQVLHVYLAILDDDATHRASHHLERAWRHPRRAKRQDVRSSRLCSRLCAQSVDGSELRVEHDKAQMPRTTHGGGATQEQQQQHPHATNENCDGPADFDGDAELYEGGLMQLLVLGDARYRSGSQWLQVGRRRRRKKQ
jgi:hypothetical protein